MKVAEQIHQQDLERVKSLRYMDDDFMTVCLVDNFEGVELIADAGAGAKRARHNGSLLDAHILKPGEDTEDIPDSYVIFITENDVMKGN